MATTALFVEILVIGALAELWLATALLAVVPHPEAKVLLAVFTPIKDGLPIFAIPALALTYALGWVANFVAERTFKPFFQERVRDRLFKGSAAKYDEARIVVLQKGSPELVRDVLVDRHIIRMARGNVLNFTLFTGALLLHWHYADQRVLLALAGTSLAIAALSFAQWLTRYRAHYKRIADASKVLSLGKTSAA